MAEQGDHDAGLGGESNRGLACNIKKEDKAAKNFGRHRRCSLREGCPNAYVFGNHSIIGEDIGEKKPGFGN